ncbi:methyltransferase domain-containing protein [Nocardioides stalactiti]|uniref:methyltransferase domain-containing protein n=1 Tax=Nocardioides stalactiti TaxID=2755356 RepID=UPI001602F7C6|nr:methyltransferase domain-containing protein [Nocardioides stalactiti]
MTDARTGLQEVRRLIDADEPAAALAILEPLVAERPEHGLTRFFRARARLATGDLDGARADADAAAVLMPDRSAADRVLARIEVAQARTDSATLVAQAAADVAIVDSGHLAARNAAPTEDVRAAVQRLAALDLVGDWTSDPTLAKIAYFHHAVDPVRALASYDPHLIGVSADFGYITWPRRIQEHVRGRSVIDVGCGFGGFGVGFLVAGATSYLGLDPAMDLDSTSARNKRLRERADMGITPRAIAENLPAVRLFRGKSEDLSFDERFDTISLHNVTEHLADPERVLAGLVALCKEDTRLVFHHHNYYCWNGHHDPPVQPAQLDPASAEHQQVVDWRHIDQLPHLPAGHRYLTTLNRIRLDELRELTERYFVVEQWEEISSSAATLARLTPEVLERVRRTMPDLTERELSVNAVLCVATPR